MKPTHKISAVYFPGMGEVEATWEDIETGETAAVTFKVNEETGNKIAKVVPPCVYSEAVISNN